MPSRVKRRLPAVRPLSEILPRGAEGGKEFARIVDLLLFHEARRAGKKLTVFDDAAVFSPSPGAPSRSRSVASTYPGNTAIVTSRIVGYEAPWLSNPLRSGWKRSERSSYRGCRS